MSDADVARELAALPAWTYDAGEIVRTYDCGNFDGAIGFVNAVAVEANAADHHPDLIVRWKSVTVRLSSHDAGGITARDFSLAHAIDRVSAR